MPELSRPALLLLACLSVSTASGQEFCAITAKLVTPDGKLVNQAEVNLLDELGMVVASGMTINGTLRICDYGLGVHSIVITRGDSYPSTISKLRLDLDHPISLVIIINPLGYDPRNWGRGCHLFIRAVDAQGNPLSDVSIQTGLKDAHLVEFDKFGRYQMLFSGHLSVVLFKEGFETSKANITCSKEQSSSRERLNLVVPMRPK